MNNFARLAEGWREHEPGPIDTVALSAWLADTPCSPLDATHVTPARAVAAAAG